MKTLCQLAFAAVSVVLAAAYAQAQEYPSRPVRIVVPTSPGTGTDVIARFLADKLPQELKGSYVIDNRVGANGIIAAETVAKAAPDGYTLLTAASLHYVNKSLYEKLSYDPVKDFRPIARVSVLYLALVVPRFIERGMRSRAGRRPRASSGWNARGVGTIAAPALTRS